MLRTVITFLMLIASAIAGEVRLTLESAPAYALNHNPAFAAARLRIEEARGRLRQSGLLSNPEIDAIFSRHTDSSEEKLGVAVMQRFPVTARLRLEKAISRAELAAAHAEVRNAERKLVADVRSGAVKLLAIDGQRELRRKQLGNSQELAGFTRGRVETGEASVVDASQVELEGHQLRTDLLHLDVERGAVTGELRGLLGLAAKDTLIIAGDLPGLISIPGSDANPALRPDFEVAENVAQAARQAAELARAQRWQDIGLGINVEAERTEDAPEGIQRDNFVGLKLAVPLPLWNRNEGRIQETAAAALRAEKETDVLARSIHAEISAARQAMRALARVVTDLEDQVLPAARHIEEQLHQTYSAGQATLQETLRARDRRLLLERQRLEALRDFHLARIRYDAATGKGSL
jgi:outer membrane protein, heavy metal efflux system